MTARLTSHEGAALIRRGIGKRPVSVVRKSRTPANGPGVMHLDGGERMTEAQVQGAILDHLKARPACDLVVAHVPNGGARDPREAAKLKWQGVRAGMPDLVIVAGGVTRWLEVKAVGGRLLASQVETIGHLRACGARVAVAHGLHEALRWLEDEGLLRPSLGHNGGPPL